MCVLGRARSTTTAAAMACASMVSVSAIHPPLGTTYNPTTCAVTTLAICADSSECAGDSTCVSGHCACTTDSDCGGIGATCVNGACTVAQQCYNNGQYCSGNGFCSTDATDCVCTAPGYENPLTGDEDCSVPVCS